MSGEGTTGQTDVERSTGQQQQAETRIDARIFNVLTRVKDDLRDRPIRYDIISIIFTLIVLAGGVYGYFSKGSLPSLISGVVFFLLLAGATYFEGANKNPYPLVIVIFIFGALMVWRYLQTYGFIPAGLFASLSLFMLLRHGYLIYSKKASDRLQPQPQQ